MKCASLLTSTITCTCIHVKQNTVLRDRVVLYTKWSAILDSIFTLAKSFIILMSICRPSSKSVVRESELERIGLTDLEL